jgi:hypothetical protein
MNLYDPSQWANVAGLWTLIAVLAATLLLAAAKLVSPRWDDWLDDHDGRGSVRDDWPDR